MRSGTMALPSPARTGTPARKDELSPGELATILLKEGRRRMLVLCATFAALAFLTLLVGLFVLPKNYSVSTTILAQESDIIQPLLEGRAVSTGVADRAGIARQVVYSRKVLQEILKVGGWLDSAPSDLQQDRLIEDIRNRTAITSPRPELVQITYRDNDPVRTFKVTEALASLFIKESLQNKERESREAFEFIDSQVQEYHRKLTEAERNLQDYRSRNADAQPGSAADMNTRISAMRSQVEQARMSLIEQESRQSSIAAQLSGESEVSAVQTRETLYRTRIVELQAELDRLLLSYTEEHPDVLRVRHQIADLQNSVQLEQERRQQSGEQNRISDDARFNPLYQELRSQQSQARREVAATRSRMATAESLLQEELGRSRRIAASESALAELTRDYEVNREIYQDLLRRRENARVSMGLDRENRGLTLRVQDPAIMPLRSTGLRFAHFAAAGLLLAIALPIGLLVLLVKFDPRIRSQRLIEQRSGYPLLTTIPPYRTRRERRREVTHMMVSASLVASVGLVFALTYAYKLANA